MLPWIKPDVAVMVTGVGVDGCSVVTCPEITVATAVFDEVHCAEVVRSTVPPLCKVPIAENWVWVFGLRLDVAGVILIEVSPATLMVAVVVPLMLAELAVIVVVPTDTPASNPVVLTVATVESEVLQNMFFVSVLVLPSSYVPVAVICKVEPACTVGVTGSTVIVVKVGLTKNPWQPAASATLMRIEKDRRTRIFCLAIGMLKSLVSILKFPERPDAAGSELSFVMNATGLPSCRILMHSEPAQHTKFHNQNGTSRAALLRKIVADRTRRPRYR